MQRARLMRIEQRQAEIEASQRESEERTAIVWREVGSAFSDGVARMTESAEKMDSASERLDESSTRIERMERQIRALFAKTTARRGDLSVKDGEPQ